MKNTKTLTRVALLVAIELVMKMVGLGSVPVGPLYMSFLTLPIAVGAITMGPAVGALLGGVFGTEGDGLAGHTIADCDYTVCIPMSHGVDSLNVAAASAVAFWQLGRNNCTIKH